MQEKGVTEIFGPWKVAFIALAAILVCMIVVSGIFSKRVADKHAAAKAAAAVRLEDGGKTAEETHASRFMCNDCPARNPWGDPYVIARSAVDSTLPNSTV